MAIQPPFAAGGNDALREVATRNGDGGQLGPPACSPPSPRPAQHHRQTCAVLVAPRATWRVLPGTLNSYAAKSLINTTSGLSPRASLTWQIRRRDDARPCTEYPRAVITTSPDHSIRAQKGCGSADGDRRSWVAAAHDGPEDVPAGYVARLLRHGGPQGPLPGS